MDEKNNAPHSNEQNRERIESEQRKISENLPKHQREVFKLLLRARLSVADISRLLGYSDPRGHISKLRKKGVNVCDEWRTGATPDVRFKVYYIPKNETLKPKI